MVRENKHLNNSSLSKEDRGNLLKHITDPKMYEEVKEYFRCSPTQKDTFMKKNTSKYKESSKAISRVKKFKNFKASSFKRKCILNLVTL